MHLILSWRIKQKKCDRENAMARRKTRRRKSSYSFAAVFALSRLRGRFHAQLQSTRHHICCNSFVPSADNNFLMRDFSDIVERMKKTYDVRVRKWRRSMSGCAWRVYYHDGRVIN